MERILIDAEGVRDWVRDALLHPNASWYAPMFDARRRSLLYLASGRHLAIDEPGRTITPALERILERRRRGDPALKALPQMSDERRVRLVFDFILSRPDPATRDALLLRFAHRPDVVFGWRPGSLFELIERGEDGEPTQLERAYVEHIKRACASDVSTTIRWLKLIERPTFVAHF